jgi:hypothetical protein
MQALSAILPCLSNVELFLGNGIMSSQPCSWPYSEHSQGDGFSTLESYSRSTYMRSASGTPLLSSSSKHIPKSGSEPITTATQMSSTQYETPQTLLVMSFASLPSIPLLYEIAEVCSTESEATKSISSQDIAKASPKDESVRLYHSTSLQE